jgi:hypothetical protein
MPVDCQQHNVHIILYKLNKNILCRFVSSKVYYLEDEHFVGFFSLLMYFFTYLNSFAGLKCGLSQFFYVLQIINKIDLIDVFATNF